MKNACEALEQLSNIRSMKEKLALLDQRKSEELAFIFHTALDPYVNCGVLTVTENDAPTRSNIPSLAELREAVSLLSKREVTGSAAKELVRRTVLTADPVVKKWLCRMFQKTLRAGVQDTTVNKVFPNLIATFPIPKCEKFDESMPIFDRQWYIEPKMDGLRAFCLIDEKGEVTFTSINNKPMYNIHIVADQIKSLGLKNVVFDGELMAMDWDKSVSVLHTQSEHEGADQLAYHIFDAVDYPTWKAQKETFPLKDRKAFLASICGAIAGLPNLRIVVFPTVRSLSEAEDYLEKYIEAGFEGAVLKDPNSSYQYDRSKFWLKWKKFFEVDVLITGFEEGKGRNVNKLGAFIVDFKGNEVRVGSGFSDEQRVTYWNQKEDVKGCVAEVKYQGVTKDGSLRFPTFLRLRPDKE